ncbi:HNH endonuclease signature motif containing protein [Microbacterium testaceum]|uniref:HNH endonuclease signature motif containing protein n=1 Tax=Microbacterium testaceum TaxID=2033 RepID=UPI001244B8B6|nr:HNH endonuclease signature motif containing protein [Microbacterium testaceum]
MTNSTPATDRPVPDREVVPVAFSAPPPSDAELDAWADEVRAIEEGLFEPDWDELFVDGDDPWPVSHDLGAFSEGPASPAGCPVSAVSETDARPIDLVHELVAVAVRRRQHTAEEYRLMTLILDGAVADPEPWVGPDPTLSADWDDSRGRTVAAVRRDRVDLAERAAAAEIAVQLRLAERTVRTRVGHARTLQTRCALAWRAFLEGRISESHAIRIARLADSLPDDRAAWTAFDIGATERAERLTPSSFETAARVLREKVHAESIDERHRRAAQDRGVWLTPELDGMATLTALLPADRAQAAMTRLDRVARHLATADGENRTLAQLRADALADLLASGIAAQKPATATVPAPGASGATGASAAVPAPGASGAPSTPAAPRPARPTVVVTVPALTLLGRDDTPATLDGYGPIDLETARRLAGEATSWIRVLTHPLTGVPLALDRTTYRVTTALRRWLGVTSPTCVFPGCTRPARECDIDHLTAWADGGTTDHDNLEPECRHHHRLRHETRWEPHKNSGDSDLRWRSPLGHDVEVDPPPF